MGKHLDLVTNAKTDMLKPVKTQCYESQTVCGNAPLSFCFKMSQFVDGGLVSQTSMFLFTLKMTNFRVCMVQTMTGSTQMDQPLQTPLLVEVMHLVQLYFSPSQKKQNQQGEKAPSL